MKSLFDEYGIIHQVMDILPDEIFWHCRKLRFCHFDNRINLVKMAHIEVQKNNFQKPVRFGV